MVRTELSQQVIGRVFSLVHNLAFSALHLMVSSNHKRDLNNLDILSTSKFEPCDKHGFLASVVSQSHTTTRLFAD